MVFSQRQNLVFAWVGESTTTTAVEVCKLNRSTLHRKKQTSSLVNKYHHILEIHKYFGDPAKIYLATVFNKY